MSPTSPADWPARAAIADRLDDTLFVGAGAGTGKTTALVGRIVRLVVSGRASLGDIAAITFTEAAAGELRDRVRAALELLAAGHPVAGTGVGGSAAPPSVEERRLAAEAVGDVDAAAISTLHGFAQRILTTHAIDAGLPPRLTVLDPVASSVAFAQRWDDIVRHLLDDEAEQEVVLRAHLCGVTLGALRAFARIANDNWDLVADHHPATSPFGTALPRIDGTAVRRHLAEALAQRASCTSVDDKLLAHLDGLEQFAAQLEREQSDLALLQLLADAPTLAGRRFGTKAAWRVPVDDVRAQLTHAQDALEETMHDVRRDVLARLMHRLGQLTLAAAADRRTAGTVEFHDLLVLARDLVRQDPDIARSLRQRFRFLLLDEFQDTDPIQAELAVRIASADEPAADHWTGCVPAPGALFFVGDPKQAIYRFRRADIELYTQVAALVGGEPVSLTTCFRSRPGILDWVNATFGALLGDGDGASQPRYEPLDTHRPPGGSTPPVVVLGEALEGLSADELRAAAAADLARTVRLALDEGWTVDDGERVLTPGDVAVLVPTRTEVPAIEAAFAEHGIPLRIHASSLLFGTTEVLDLLAVLRAVDDPGDPVAVVGALRTPLYACGDDDLVRWRLAGGGWDPAEVRPDLGGPVADALAHLTLLHTERIWHDVPTVVERLLADRNAELLALDQARPRDAWRRLRFVADQSRAFWEAGGTDLRGFLAWIDALADDDARSSEAVLPETDDDAVRLLTIHGSKGLEFPMVLIAGLDKAATAERGVRVRWGPTGAEASFGKGLDTIGFDALDTHEQHLIRLERLRVLYVACTRARDHLVLALHHKAGADCHAAALLTLDAEHPELRVRLDPPDRQLGPRDRPDAADEAAPTPSAAPATEAELDAELSDWARHRHLASRSVAVAPSSLGRHPVDTDAEPDVARPAWQRGRGGTELGRAVHGCLQLVDLTTGAGLDDLARSQAIAEGIPDRAAEVARVARVALASEVVRAAAASPRVLREFFVGTPVGGRVLEGFIDLLVDTADGWWLVDYKTAMGASDADLASRLASATPQGAAYALAVEAVTGRPVNRCTFLYLRGADAVALDVADLPAAITAVRTELLTS